MSGSDPSTVLQGMRGTRRAISTCMHLSTYRQDNSRQNLRLGAPSLAEGVLGLHRLLRALTLFVQRQRGEVAWEMLAMASACGLQPSIAD